MKKYKLIKKKGEGTFSEVVQAMNTETDKMYAVKCMKSSYKNVEQVNSLREIQALRKLAPHPNIINLEEVLFDEPTGRLALVFELMEANLYDLISGRREHLDSELVRSIGYQMFEALKYIHSRSVFHRDIKPENILVDKSGTRVKIADLGSCRSMNSKPPFTEYIATRWYRPPECLLTQGHYGAPMDVWGAGCVLFEITSLFPLFPGADELDQINRIHKVIGTPDKDVLIKLKKNKSGKIDFKFKEQKGVGIRNFIPHASTECVHFLKKTLIYDYSKRITSSEAYEHKYFEQVRERKSKSGESRSSSTKQSDESRHEKPTSRAQEFIVDKVSRNNDDFKKYRFRVEGKVETRNLVKAKIKDTNKTNRKMEHKPTNLKKVLPTEKPKATSKTVSRVGISKNQCDDKIKLNQRTINQRLPKLNQQLKKTNDLRPEMNVKTKNTKYTNFDNLPKRRNKYAHITSSGYGKATSKPTNSKPTNDSSVNRIRKDHKNIVGRKQLLKEGKLQKLPAVT